MRTPERKRFPGPAGCGGGGADAGCLGGAAFSGLAEHPRAPGEGHGPDGAAVRAGVSLPRRVRHLASPEHDGAADGPGGGGLHGNLPGAEHPLSRGKDHGGPAPDAGVLPHGGHLPGGLPGGLGGVRGGDWMGGRSGLQRPGRQGFKRESPDELHL